MEGAALDEGVRDDRGAGRHSPSHADGGGRFRSYRQALEGRVGPSAWHIPPMETGPASAVEVTGLARHSPQGVRGPRVVAIQSVVAPRSCQVLAAGELVTPTPPDKAVDGANPRELETN